MLAGGVYKGSPAPNWGAGLNSCPDGHITCFEHRHYVMENETTGSGREGQRTTEQLDPSFSSEGHEQLCACAPAIMAPLIIDSGIGTSSLH